MEFKLAEIFCGPGGIGSAAKKSNVESPVGEKFSINPVWSNDIDRDTCDTYLKNIHGVDPNEGLEIKNKLVACCDVREIDFKKDVPDFNALAFGFPCNDFSLVGEQLGTDGIYGPLYTNAVRAINAKNPEWFLAENVGGLRSANGGKAFGRILCDLISAGKKGYRLSVNLYKFEDYGVPQARHRVIIVGIRKDLNLHFHVPAPSTKDHSDKVTSKMALEQPPIPAFAGNQELTKQSSQVVERLKMLPPDKNAWFLDDLIALDDDPNLEDALVDFYRDHPKITQKVVDVDFTNRRSIRAKLNSVRLNVKSARMSQIYRRLDPNKPSYTVTGSGGGGTHCYHWAEDRALTNRERARIQTFDDSHFFVGSKESVRKQIGMAVPPRGAQVIFEALLNSFAGIPYAQLPGGANIGDFNTAEDVFQNLEPSLFKKVSSEII